MRRFIFFIAMLAFGVPLFTALQVHAQMPPSTYDGPVGQRIVAQFNNTVTSIQTGNYVAPWANLAPGQYINPTSGKVEGTPICGRWGRPFC